MFLADSRPPWKRAARTGLDVVLLVGIAIVGRSLTRPALHVAEIQADVEAVGREAVALHAAFRSYARRHGQFPNAWAEPAFDEVTLDPLRGEGDYDGLFNSKLLDGRIDAYDSPDDTEENDEYWLEMTLARDPSIRFVVARSDDAPLAGGRWLDGAFLFRDGSLERL